MNATPDRRPAPSPQGGPPTTGQPGAEATLLVVDGEPTIRELLSAGLRLAGFRAVAAATGAEAVETARRDPPDLVVLDVTLPDIDGYEVVRRLRGGPVPRGADPARPVPVLFLTARDTVRDRVEGLSRGADDYVAKPFSLDELIARIRAVLRRSGVRAADGGALLRCADLELDPVGHRVTRSGGPIRLSPTEFKLLHFLLANPGRVVSKTQILDEVWGPRFAGDRSIVESYISYLRRKVDAGRAQRLIHTVRGIGYVLRPSAA